MLRKTDGRGVSVGKKLKKARIRKKMTLDQVANTTGCSIDFLKNIEACREIPPVGTLLQIAKALQIDSGDLLGAQQEARATRADAYRKRTQNYAYTALTPGAENNHLKAFRVMINAMQAHEGVGYFHEGEEFVYIIKGTIEVTVGDHTNCLKKGESLHFNSGIQHFMRNVGKQDAEMIVVVYIP